MELIEMKKLKIKNVEVDSQQANKMMLSGKSHIE